MVDEPAPKIIARHAECCPSCSTPRCDLIHFPHWVIIYCDGAEHGPFFSEDEAKAHMGDFH